MYCGPLPNVPTLFAHASVIATPRAVLSATGIACSMAVARSRHDSERAERLAALLADPASPGSHIGYATGDDADAPLRAMHEMIERWRVAEWWAGLRSASRPCPAAAVAFDAARRRWPRRTTRPTGLLQVEPEDLPPGLVAWSCDADGRAICTAAACGPTAGDAARAVLRELYQMEFGLEISRRRAVGRRSQNGFDRAVLDRASQMTLAHLGTLGFVDSPAADPVTVDDLGRRLARHGSGPDVRIVAEAPRVFRAAFRPRPQRHAPRAPGISDWPFYLHA